MARDRAFTLVELMITLAVLAVLAGVGVPYLLAGLPAQRVNAATRHLLGDFRLARTLAVERGVECLTVFDAPNSSYTVVLDTDGVPGVSAGDETVKTIRLGDEYSGIEMGNSQTANPVTFVGDTALFRPRGTSNGGSVFLRPGQDSGGRRDRERKVTVMSTTGRARAFRWNGSDWE